VTRRHTGASVFDAALARIRELYASGHRVVVSFSGGKDSTVTLELAALAARAEGEPVVEAVMRDDEIMPPGTFQYAKRLCRRADLGFTWLWSDQPVPNALGPAWHPFDPAREAAWVRRPPPRAMFHPDLYLADLVTAERFPPLPGREVCVLIGCRAEESRQRNFAVHSMGGHLARRPRPGGGRVVWPIYDWTLGDVWRAIVLHGWDFNRAYAEMARAGWPTTLMRVAPPAMSAGGVATLCRGGALWPEWFAAVRQRVPGAAALDPCAPPADRGRRRAIEDLAAPAFSEAWRPDRATLLAV
jgi:predicted phosphoadenosine phosphosulfate sulfurtransferase